MTEQRWRKSSYSGSQANCVEVGGHDGAILVRDTKEHGLGQIHRYTPAAWRMFVATIKAGQPRPDER